MRYAYTTEDLLQAVDRAAQELGVTEEERTEALAAARKRGPANIPLVRLADSLVRGAQARLEAARNKAPLQETTEDVVREIYALAAKKGLSHDVIDGAVKRAMKSAKSRDYSAKLYARMLLFQAKSDAERRFESSVRAKVIQDMRETKSAADQLRYEEEEARLKREFQFIIASLPPESPRNFKKLLTAVYQRKFDNIGGWQGVAKNAFEQNVSRGIRLLADLGASKALLERVRVIKRATGPVVASIYAIDYVPRKDPSASEYDFEDDAYEDDGYEDDDME